MTAGASTAGGSGYVPQGGPDGQPYGGHDRPVPARATDPGAARPAAWPHLPNPPYTSYAPLSAYAPNSSFAAPHAAPGQPPAGGYRAAAHAPGVGPVVACTAVFGVAGAISAWRRASRAEAAGLPGGRYWKAFAVTLAVSWVCWTLVGALLASSSWLPRSSPAGVSTTSLEDSIVRDGDFTDPFGAAAVVQSALCTAGEVDAGGAGAYRCLVGFAGGRSESYQVTVDANGGWVVD